MSELLTLDAAAARMHVPRRTLQNWIREGKVECVRLSHKKVYMTEALIERAIARHTKTGGKR